MEFRKPLDETVWRGLKGRCISCGYLGKHSRYYTEVYEASEFDRSVFGFVSHRLPPPTPSGTEIWCFVNELPLAEEFKRLEKHTAGLEITLKSHWRLPPRI